MFAASKALIEGLFAFYFEAARGFGGLRIPVVAVQPTTVDHRLDLAVLRLDLRPSREPALVAQVRFDETNHFQFPLPHF
ncbi:MAG: hypothetical protein C4342_05490 [Armatimonadota bacterium]